MSKGTETRTILAEMEVGFLPPVMREDLARGWRFRGEVEAVDELTELRLYVDEEVAKVIAQVNPGVIVSTAMPALDEMRKRPETTARELIAAADTSFAMDPIDTDQVRRVAVQAFERLQTAREDSATISRALVVTRRADDVLDSLESSVKAFLFDRDVAPKQFKTAVDRERFAGVVLADLISWRRWLATLRAELVALDDRLDAVREELLRAMATLTLFKDLGKQDVQTGMRVNSPQIAMFAPGVTRSRFEQPNG